MRPVWYVQTEVRLQAYYEGAWHYTGSIGFAQGNLQTSVTARTSANCYSASGLPVLFRTVANASFMTTPSSASTRLATSTVGPVLC